MTGSALPLAVVLPLSEAAEAAVEWTARRDDLIRQARAAGHSWRQIADAVGLSHTAIANIVAR